MTEQSNSILIYQATDGTTRLEVKLDQETVWLSLNQMVSLFERDKSVISRHLKSIFSSGELERDSVVAFFATTAADGKTHTRPKIEATCRALGYEPPIICTPQELTEEV